MTDAAQPNLDTLAREILDTVVYMMLGTADVVFDSTVSQQWVLDPDVSPDQRTPVAPGAADGRRPRPSGCDGRHRRRV
jgi:hypothetical protein